MIVAAAQDVPQSRLVGTAALTAAVARSRAAQSPGAPVQLRASRSSLTVVGTADVSAAEQVALLRDSGVRHVLVNSADLLSNSAEPSTILEALDSGNVVVSVGGPVVPAEAARLVFALAELIVVVDASRVGREYPLDLVLTGGETARSVLDRLGVEHLSPVCEIEYGAVLSSDLTGRYVVTRPGSFGDVRSLLSITEFLSRPASVVAPHSPRSVNPSDNEVNAMPIESAPLPLIAVTMGTAPASGPK